MVRETLLQAQQIQWEHDKTPYDYQVAHIPATFLISQWLWYDYSDTFWL